MPIPAFIVALREKVGHHPLWLTGVTAVVLDDEDRVLLTLRSDTHRWALVAGVLEPGEEPAPAIVREVREETGVDVVVEGLVSVRAGEPMAYPNGDRAQYLDVLFLVRAVGGEAHVADDESLEVAWFPLDALPDGVGHQAPERIADALAYRANPSAGARFAPA